MCFAYEWPARGAVVETCSAVLLVKGGNGCMMATCCSFCVYKCVGEYMEGNKQ